MQCRAFALITYIWALQLLRAHTEPASDWKEEINQIQAFENAGKLSEAATVSEKLVAQLQKSNPRSAVLAAALDRLGSEKQDLGKYGDAQHLYETAIQLWRALPDAPSPELATEMNNLASLHSEMGQLQKAETEVRESLALRVQLLGAENAHVAVSQSNLAAVLFREGKDSEAREMAESAVRIWDKGAPEHNQADLAFNTLAGIGLKEHNAASALRFAQLALATYQRRDGSSRVQAATYKHILGLAKELDGDTTGAAQMFEESLSGLEPFQSRLLLRARILADYSQLARRIGQKRKARHLQNQANREALAFAKENSIRYTIDVNSLRDGDVNSLRERR